MHYNRHYIDEDRKKNDEQAIADIKEYLSEKQWDVLMQLVGGLKADGSTYNFQHVNMALGFTGIEGYPVHAFGRTYCLEQYKEWMKSDIGGEPVPIDDEGFPIKQ